MDSAPTPSPPTTGPILVVEDDEAVRDVVCRYLRREGIEVREAADGPTALAMIERESPALVVLDVMLPGMDGLEVCRRTRATRDVPIIMLTARTDETDRVVGLELGADDYVTKPFSPRELLARIRAVTRRHAPRGEPDVLHQGALAMDRGLHTASVGGLPVELTAREFDLLWFLASHPRHVFSRDQLMDRVWGHMPALDSGTVAVHMRRLREKVEADPSHPAMLQTVWGVGYRFVP